MGRQASGVREGCTDSFELPSLNCILTQRLVRVLCRACRRPARYPREVLEESKLDPVLDANRTFFEPGGCEDCHNSGFRGRTAVAELVEVTDPIKALIMDRRPGTEIYAGAQAAGTVPLRDAALAKARAGITILAEINRVTFAD